MYLLDYLCSCFKSLTFLNQSYPFVDFLISYHLLTSPYHFDWRFCITG